MSGLDTSQVARGGENLVGGRILISQQNDFPPPGLACWVKDVIKCPRH